MVMSSYMEHGGAGQPWDELSMIVAPPGTSLGALPAQGMFAEVSNALGLQSLGVYTPWATRASDTTWDEIRNPDTNVACWAITDAQVNAVTQLTYGSPLPFVAIITKGPMTQASVAAMWDGTAYAPYETQALYRQDDAKGIPTIFFLHWGERIDIAALPKQVFALEPRAAAVGGALVFSAQVPVQGSTTREPPAVPSFQSALEAQMMVNGPITAQTGPIPGQRGSYPESPPAAPSSKMNLSLPIAVGAGAAVLGYFLWSKR